MSDYRGVGEEKPYEFARSEVKDLLVNQKRVNFMEQVKSDPVSYTHLNIKVEQEDVLKMARDTTKAQFAQYGMLSIPDDVLDNYAQEMLKKKETINNLVSRCLLYTS